MAVPGAVEGELFELATYLASELPEESSERASSAIEVLRGVFDLRVWRQHKGTDERAARGMRRLDLVLPPADWGVAWQHVQARAVAALSALREELDSLGG